MADNPAISGKGSGEVAISRAFTCFRQLFKSPGSNSFCPACNCSSNAITSQAVAA